MTTTSATLASQQNQLRDAFATVTSAGNTTTGFMTDNSQTIIVLSQESRKALAATAPYASEFPCVLKATSDFIPQMDKVLGKGTDEPGMHVVLNVEPSRGKYVAGKDRPTHAVGGPQCPYETGQVGTSAAPRRGLHTSSPSGSDGSTSGSDSASDSAVPTIPAPPSDALEQQVTDTAASGLGQVNSPAENQMIAELVAPTVGMSPSQYPDWGSLLVGPLLRGAEVTLK
jgi:phospholipid/cholesterol/gamma-HCH transport system substrate-binding protein